MFEITAEDRRAAADIVDRFWAMEPWEELVRDLAHHNVRVSDLVREEARKAGTVDLEFVVNRAADLAEELHFHATH